jgi:hypothetical protein
MGTGKIERARKKVTPHPYFGSLKANGNPLYHPSGRTLVFWCRKYLAVVSLYRPQMLFVGLLLYVLARPFAHAKIIEVNNSCRVIAFTSIVALYQDVLGNLQVWPEIIQDRYFYGFQAKKLPSLISTYLHSLGK